MQKTDKINKIVGIEYIRSFAVISVFLHHVGVYYNLDIPYFKVHGGWLGVYLFFIISGYLITKNIEKYTKAMRNRKVSISYIDLGMETVAAAATQLKLGHVLRSKKTGALVLLTTYERAT